LDEWRLALEGKILEISRSKTEYMEYKFEGRDLDVDGTRRAMQEQISNGVIRAV